MNSLRHRRQLCFYRDKLQIYSRTLQPFHYYPMKNQNLQSSFTKGILNYAVVIMSSNYLNLEASYYAQTKIEELIDRPKIKWKTIYLFNLMGKFNFSSYSKHEIAFPWTRKRTTSFCVCIRATLQGEIWNIISS